MAIMVLDRNTELAETVLARTPRIFGLLPAAIILLLGAAGTWAYMTEIDTIIKCPIRVRTRSSPQKGFTSVSGQKICSGAGGRIAQIHIQEGGSVKAGDVMMELDCETLDNEIAANERQMTDGAAEIEHLSKMIDALEVERKSTVEKSAREISEAEESLRAERAQLEMDEKTRMANEKVADLEAQAQKIEVDSQTELFKKDVVSRVQFMRSEYALKTLEAKLEVTRIPRPDASARVAARRIETITANRDLVNNQLKERILEMQLQLLKRKAELDTTQKSLTNLKLERKRCIITTPVDGIVTMSKMEAGDHVDPGTLIATIAQPGAFRIDAAVPAADIGRVKPGMTARVKLDAFDFRKYGTLDAHVQLVMPDSELIDGKSIAYLVQMDLPRSELSAGAMVKLGMTGQAEILVEKDRLLWSLLRSLKKQAEVN